MLTTRTSARSGAWSCHSQGVYEAIHRGGGVEVDLGVREGEGTATSSSIFSTA